MSSAEKPLEFVYCGFSLIILTSSSLVGYNKKKTIRLTQTKVYAAGTTVAKAFPNALRLPSPSNVSHEQKCAEDALSIVQPALDESKHQTCNCLL